MTIIRSHDDLRNWLRVQTNGEYSERDQGLLVFAVLDCEECPDYGADWAEFLDGLPPLWRLLEVELELLDMNARNP